MIIVNYFYFLNSAVSFVLFVLYVHRVSGFSYLKMTTMMVWWVIFSLFLYNLQLAGGFVRMNKFWGSRSVVFERRCEITRKYESVERPTTPSVEYVNNKKKWIPAADRGLKEGNNNLGSFSGHPTSQKNVKEDLSSFPILLKYLEARAVGRRLSFDEKHRVNEGLKIIANNKDSYSNLSDLLKLLQNLAILGFYSNERDGMKLFISKCLVYLKDQQLDEEYKLNFLFTCARLAYRFPALNHQEKVNLKEFVLRVSASFVTKDFSIYASYLHSLSRLEFFWNDFPVNWRVTILNALIKFDEVENLPLLALAQLVHGFECLLVFKGPDEINSKAKKNYLRFLVRVSRAILSPTIRDNSEAERDFPVS